MRSGLILLPLLFLGFAASVASAAGAKARHVVVMVWDGMRPDFVNETDTPNLSALAARGVTFENHHPTYASLTEGNGAVLFTGMYPGRTGILGDLEYRPEIDALKPVHPEEFEVVRKGDDVYDRAYVHAATVPEILRSRGRKTAVAGAKGIALLADRVTGPNIFAGHAFPGDLLGTVMKLHGDFPEQIAEQPSRDDWTTSAMIDPLWRTGVPDFSLLWLAEPDLAQHRTGVGSVHSLAMIHEADVNLGRILKELERRQVLATTDIMVVSDHGFSTISAVVDAAESLQAAGIDARREFTNAPKRGDVLVVGNGGAVFVYVAGHDEAMIRRVVTNFQGWNRTGVIFTKRSQPGTFSLAQIRNDAPSAPDVMVSLRWTADKNDAGVPGMIFSDVSAFGAGQGMHCTLSRFDMHNMLIAAGPDFREGVTDHLPSGNVDLAPTILWIMGVKPPKAMDGRVLTEALTFAGPKIKSFEPGRVEARVQLEKAEWRQYLNFTEVNGVTYFDEGNGEQISKEPAAK